MNYWCTFDILSKNNFVIININSKNVQKMLSGLDVSEIRIINKATHKQACVQI